MLLRIQNTLIPVLDIRQFEELGSDALRVVLKDNTDDVFHFSSKEERTALLTEATELLTEVVELTIATYIEAVIRTIPAPFPSMGKEILQ